MTHDVFISHASEDKERVADPLAEALSGRGLDVWYDTYRLRIGHDIWRVIAKGLESTRYAVVILSPTFLRKSFATRELHFLLERVRTTGRDMLLPVHYGVTHDELRQFSGPLSEIKAFVLGPEPGREIETLARSIWQKINPGAYVDLESVPARVLADVHKIVSSEPVLGLILKEGVDLGELVRHIIDLKSVDDLVRVYYERGQFMYDPGSRGWHNMVADDDIQEKYTEIHNAMRLLMTRPSMGP